ncbi:hypothetical protein J31TS4_17220 [Paenibacillus sp. J31TS4]|uniref:hypothetical protein n=1 Tax=Paenibacillus sp. J31TS4 TaxID=2807195 RepID=UPI001B1C88FD|nr:hypothetical protein [Paenibacillus sp. J31TS4]GIP38442.1 hypothetical protein J31TS4_17220 [Paenibacillus sp. J31TS4]
MKKYILSTTEQLRLCVSNDVVVEVMIEGEIDYIGKMTKVTDEIVGIRDGFYLRRNCIIRLKSKKRINK